MDRVIRRVQETLDLACAERDHARRCVATIKESGNYRPSYLSNWERDVQRLENAVEHLEKARRALKSLIGETP